MLSLQFFRAEPVITEYFGITTTGVTNKYRCIVVDVSDVSSNPIRATLLLELVALYTLSISLVIIVTADYAGNLSQLVLLAGFLVGNQNRSVVRQSLATNISEHLGVLDGNGLVRAVSKDQAAFDVIIVSRGLLNSLNQQSNVLRTSIVVININNVTVLYYYCYFVLQFNLFVAYIVNLSLVRSSFMVAAIAISYQLPPTIML